MKNSIIFVVMILAGAGSALAQSTSPCEIEGYDPADHRHFKTFYAENAAPLSELVRECETRFNFINVYIQHRVISEYLDLLGCKVVEFIEPTRPPGRPGNAPPYSEPRTKGPGWAICESALD